MYVDLLVLKMLKSIVDGDIRLNKEVIRITGVTDFEANPVEHDEMTLVISQPGGKKKLLGLKFDCDGNSGPQSRDKFMKKLRNFL